MTITFPCSGCGKQYKAKLEQAGRRIKCKDCGTVLSVPIPRGHVAASQADHRATAERPVHTTAGSATPNRSRDDAEEVSCPNCRAPCRILPQWRGQTLECPTCQRRFVVPLIGAAPSRAAP